MSKIKQVIVIRKDLKMRRGKEIAQGSHASLAFLTRRIQKYEAQSDKAKEPLDFYFFMTDVEREWINGIFRKICLQAQSEEELLAVYEAAKEIGLEAHLITDAGITEFNGVSTHTAVGIGPDLDERIDTITGPEGKFPLKLY